MWEAGDIPVPASSGQKSKGGQDESDPGRVFQHQQQLKLRREINCQEYLPPKNP